MGPLAAICHEQRPRENPGRRSIPGPSLEHMRIRREYFYQVDREGRLFHDGTELTEPGFLDFFFSRVEINGTGLHADCAFVSPCGAEMNYIVGHETPIVFRRLEWSPESDTGDEDRLVYGGTLSTPFRPERLCYDARDRLFHPVGLRDEAPDPRRPVGRLGRHVVLELAPFLEVEDGQVTLRWRGQPRPLTRLSSDQ